MMTRIMAISCCRSLLVFICRCIKCMSTQWTGGASSYKQLVWSITKLIGLLILAVLILNVCGVLDIGWTAEQQPVLYRGRSAASSWVEELSRDHEVYLQWNSSERRSWSDDVTDVDVEKAYHPTVYRQTNINCKALFLGDEVELRKSRSYMKTRVNRKISAEHYLHLTNDCKTFRKTRGYYSRPRSRDEEFFPIAFSILVKDDIEQVERLLRAIYAPQNVYCIHVDMKTTDTVLAALRQIVRCFDNVFIPTLRESVYWGHISIVYAEMNCMEELLKYHWKYFINLSGQMFPAHTNAELVQILQLYDGANDVEGSYKRSQHYWIKVRYTFQWRLLPSLKSMMMTLSLKGNSPYNVTIYKGSNQVALTRAFVVYFLYSPVSRDLVTWFSDTLAADEYIWPTLNHNKHLYAPGSYKGDPETKIFTVRASLWQSGTDQIDWSWKHRECRGKWVRTVCILGVGDMPWMFDRPELFINKFHANYEPLAYDCLEEHIHNRTVCTTNNSSTIGPCTQPMKNNTVNFDPTYYLALPFVRNKTELVVSLPETKLHQFGINVSDAV